MGVSRYTNQLEVTAFKNQDHIVFIVLNRTEGPIPAYIRMNGECAKILARPLSISSGLITLGESK